MTLKAILFDHDGTLVDSEGVHLRHWQQVLRQHGVTLSESEFREHCCGNPVTRIAHRLVDRHGLKVPPEVLAQQKEETTRAHLAREAFPLMPYAHEAIRFFSGKDIRLGVVTGAGPAGITATLKVHGLSNRFSVVVTASDVIHSKPAPDCYLLALEKLGVKADECLAIEDTEHGIQAAVSAGIACCGIPNPYSASQDFSRAVVTCADLDRATEWVARTYRLGVEAA